MEEGQSKKNEPRSFWPRSRRPFSLLENVDDDWDLLDFTSPSGLTVSEDDHKVYVEAALPGVKPADVDMIFDRGILWIKGEKKEETEDKRKKFYRKAIGTFSYRIVVPGEIDESKPPEAVSKNGILKVVFFKIKGAHSKKIPVKEG